VPYPEEYADTVLYREREFIADKDLALRLVDGTRFDLWGNVYINGSLFSRGATQQEVDIARFDRQWMDDAYTEATRILGPTEAPELSYSAGTTTTIPGSVEYKISICGTGTQITNWNGQDDPNFSIQWGPWQSMNGANNDFAMLGSDKSGVNGYAWLPSLEFDLSDTADAFEIQLYGPSNIVNIWKNGIRCNDRIYAGNNSIGGTSSKLLKVQFPYPIARRIKILSNRVRSIRVPAGVTLTKPTDVRSRRIGVFGDSHVNGASGGLGAMGCGVTDTHAAYFIDAMHGQGVYGGVGGRAWSPATANPHTLVTAEVGAASPVPIDLAMVYASTNDGPETSANIQAGMEAGLSHLAAVPKRFVISTPHGGTSIYDKINNAAKAAAATAGVPFVDLRNVFWGPGHWANPLFTGTASWFQRPDGTEHMTPIGHRTVGRMVFRAVCEYLTYGSSSLIP